MINDLVLNWQTSLAGLLAGGLTYATQVGASIPQNRQEWAAAGLAAAMLWLGAKAKDTGTPR